ncbi:MAG: asparaginase [Oscillospiraceae bacterium]|nr:asparaginase [Oscillospiraceae bacterium]
MKEKILVCFTGGTIQSHIKDGSIQVTEEPNYLLLDMYKGCNARRDIDFDIISPTNILSEFATIEDWMEIAESIKKKDVSQYKGIIMTYGTDTLGYFANVISYLLNDIDIPVMIVADNFILSDKRSTGLANFVTAVDFVVSKSYKGVFVPFTNSTGELYIHRGTRIKQLSQLSDSAFSIRHDHFAQVINGEIVERREHIPHITKDKADYKLSNEILYLKPVIGKRYGTIDLNGYRAVYFESFHTNAVPREATEVALQCKEKGILFFIGAMRTDAREFYEGTADAVKAGAIFIKDMSHEAIYGKLMVALRDV